VDGRHHSRLGSGLATVAAPLLVASQTDDPLTVSLTAAVSWLPWLLFPLPGGVLVGRVDRRQLMIAIDVVRVVVVSVLALAVGTGWAGIPLLFGVLFVVSTGEVVFRSANQALVPAVVPRPFRLTAPYRVGFVVAVLVSAATWRVFDRATVAAAHAAPAPA
jgi:MFS family permease